MNPPNKKPPGTRAIPQPFNRPVGHAPHFKPVVAQLKTPVSAQSAKRPVAPPVYRPQAVPKVMQLKTSNGIANSKLPVAPPVYRPSPRPVEFQRTVGGSRAVQLAKKQPMASSSSSSSSSSQDKEKKRLPRSVMRERSRSPQPRGESEAPDDDRSRSRSRGRRSHSVGEDDAPGELGKRERRPSLKAKESEGDRRSERRRSVVDGAAERKQLLNEFVKPADKKPGRVQARGAPGVNAPRGVFLMFGQRGELGWATTSATHGMNGDVYIYHLAKSGHRVNRDLSGPPDYRLENGRDEYRCAACKQYFPLLAQKRAGEAHHITVDHVPPMSQRLHNGDCVATFCDGTNVWQGQHKTRCKESYNDPDHLQMMCDSHNSSKGGLSGYSKWEPECLGPHDTWCDLEESHSDVREVGRKAGSE